jgi:hypothetical protein
MQLGARQGHGPRDTMAPASYSGRRTYTRSRPAVRCGSATDCGVKAPLPAIARDEPPDWVRCGLPRNGLRRSPHARTAGTGAFQLPWLWTNAAAGGIESQLPTVTHC